MDRTQYIARYSIPIDDDGMIFYYVFSTRMMSQTQKLMVLLNLLKTMKPKLCLSNIVNVASHKMFVAMETKDVVGGAKVWTDAEDVKADVVLL